MNKAVVRIEGNSTKSVTVSSSYAYLFVISGSNYAQYSGILTMGYNGTPNLSTFTSRNITANAGTFGRVSFTNSGSGAVYLQIIPIQILYAEK